MIGRASLQVSLTRPRRGRTGMTRGSEYPVTSPVRNHDGLCQWRHWHRDGHGLLVVTRAAAAQS